MSDSKDYLPATDAPHIIIVGDKTLQFPRIKLRNMSVLAAKCKAIQVKNLKALIEEEKPENRARFMALTVARDFNLSDVWDWATTLDGAIQCMITSLMQRGMTEPEANTQIDVLNDSEECINIATEITGHPNAPTKVALRLLEAERKKALNKKNGEPEDTEEKK